MDMMKKILLLILAVSLMAGAVVIAEEVPEGDTVPANSLTQSDQVKIQLLTYLGVISKAPEAAPATRGNFAAYLTALTNLQITAAKNDTAPFSDVKKGAPNASYIKAVTELGYMNGTQEGLFEPDKAITAVEAATALLRMMGYQEYAAARGGYPTGYLAIASEQRLFMGIDTGKEELDEIDVMRLCYNAATAPLLQLTSVGENRGYEAVKGRTLLSEYHKIYDGKGLVTANKYTATYTQTQTCGEDEIEIDKTKYACAKEIDQSLLGRNVEFFYQDNSKYDLPYLVAAGERSGKNQSLTIPAKDIASAGSGKLSYYVEGEKKKTVSLKTSFDYILNMRAETDYTSIEDIMIPDGALTLVDNDGDDIYDIVFAERLETYVVSGIDPNLFAIYCEGGVVEFDPYQSGVYFDILLTNGEGEQSRADINEIKNGNVISVYASSDRKYTKILVSSATAEGEVTAKDDDYVYIGKDNAYETLPKCNTDIIRTGKTIKAYLDVFGRIVKVEEIEDARGFQYGYLIDAAPMGGIKSLVQLQIMTAAGAQVFDARTSLYVDGIKGVNIENGNSALYENGKVKRQALRFRVDNEDYIDAIDTEAKGGNGRDEALDSFELVTTGGLRYSSSFNSFGNRFKVGNSTLIVGIPSQDADQAENYRLGHSFENWTSQTMSVYDVDEDCEPKLITYVSTTSSKVPDLTEYSSVGIVKKIIRGANEDGNEVDCVELMTSTGAQTFNVSEDCPGYVSSEKGNPSFVPGDVILYAVNTDKELANFFHHFKFSTQAVQSTKNGYFQLIYGRAYSKHTNYFTVLNKNMEIGEPVDDLSARVLAPATGGTFYYVTMGRKNDGTPYVKNIQKTTYDSLTTAKDNLGQECLVYCRTYQDGRLYDCVMYQYTD